MTPDEFFNRPLDPLTYYPLLPSDGVALAPLPLLPDPVSLRREFLAVPAADIPATILKTLLLSMLAHPRAWRDIPLHDIAHHSSLGYAKLLSGGKTRRAHRMQLQQLNYFARDLLDWNVSPPENAATTQTSFGHTLPPWDWMPVDPDGELSIISGKNGLRWHRGAQVRHFDAGAPSQLDTIDADRISVGSIFSNGGFVFSGGDLRAYPSERPVVLLFLFEGRLLGIDYAGQVVAMEDGVPQGRAAVGQVDRARLDGDSLLLSDWTEPHCIFRYELSSGNTFRIDLPDIILLNDIVRIGNDYYAVCKQQGSVFKLNRDFICVDRRLSFGKGPGRLFDPITIRFHDGAIHIVSWVTASLTRIALF